MVHPDGMPLNTKLKRKLHSVSGVSVLEHPFSELTNAGTTHCDDCKTKETKVAAFIAFDLRP